MNVYKAVRYLWVGKNDRFTSVVMRNDCMVVYEIGKVATPKQNCNPLYTFANLAAARKWAMAESYFADLLVVECDAEQSTQDEVYTWSNHKLHLSRLPDDTVLCSSVIPTAVILNCPRRYI